MDGVQGSRARPPDPRPLQPDDWTAAAVPPEWLLESDASDEGRAADRLLGDSKMLLQLQLAGYEGKAWAYFSDVLAHYGFAVICSWLRRGLIVQKCKEKRILRGLPHTLGPMSEDETLELAGEIVAEGIYYFREQVLKTNKWDPNRGASLRTFFIGQCLFRFPEVYRRWDREEKSRPEDFLGQSDADLPGSDDPAVIATQRVTVDRLLGELDDRTADVLILASEGLRHKEIAQEMARRTGKPVTAKAVENILYRHRQREQQKGA